MCFAFDSHIGPLLSTQKTLTILYYLPSNFNPSVHIQKTQRNLRVLYPVKWT